MRLDCWAANDRYIRWVVLRYAPCYIKSVLPLTDCSVWNPVAFRHNRGLFAVREISERRRLNFVAHFRAHNSPLP